MSAELALRGVLSSNVNVLGLSNNLSRHHHHILPGARKISTTHMQPLDTDRRSFMVMTMRDYYDDYCP